ncbi:hypothetical protein SAMN05421640_3732, partial [Ekhidna lutea]
MKRVFGILALGLMIVADLSAQDHSIGINVLTPNPNAALHISSNNSNQGVLLPGLSTAQRISLSLDSEDTGLLVFDTDLKSFFYWNGTVWEGIRDGVNDEDADPANEIQDLNLSGNDLTITGNGAATTIDLSAYLDDTDTKLTETEVDAFVANNGYLTTEADGSTTNEIQDLNLSGNDLTITGNGAATTIDLSA